MFDTSVAKRSPSESAAAVPAELVDLIVQHSFEGDVQVFDIVRHTLLLTCRDLAARRLRMWTICIRLIVKVLRVRGFRSSPDLTGTNHRLCGARRCFDGKSDEAALASAMDTILPDGGNRTRML